VLKLPDDFELEDIVVENIETTAEIRAGSFELTEATTTIPFNTDELHDSIIVDFLDSTGAIPSTTNSQTMMLEFDDADILIDIGYGEESKALALRPVESVLAVYAQAKNEVAKLERRNEELSDVINNVNALRKDMYMKLREFLDKPIFDVFPKALKFTTAKYHKEGDFRTYIISKFFNMQSSQLGYTKADLVEDVTAVYKAEYDVNPNVATADKIEDAINRFVTFADSLLKESVLVYQSSSFKQGFINEVHCPEAVTADSYVCQCGNEIVMPYGRPPLCFFIRKLGSGTEVRLMNQPVICTGCNRVLALPEALISEIEVRGTEYINKINATYESWRIYRPKLDALLTLIPSDAHELFQFNGMKQAVIDASGTLSSTAASNYKKLIGMWMSNELAKNRLSEVTASFIDSGNLGGTQSLIKHLSKVKLNVVPDLYAYQFVKTLLFYLEEFAPFSLTNQQAAFYEYCKLEGIQKISFDSEFANKWIRDNAWALAGLNNLFSGDTKMTSLNVLPEYEDSINYVLCLHMLSNPSIVNKDSKLGKWLRDPTLEANFFEALYTKHKVLDNSKLVKSKRDLVDKTTSFERYVWNDLYHFAKTILAPVRMKLSPELKAIASEALTKTEDEFYERKAEVQYLIRPTMRFEEFKQAFAGYGWALFTGSHCNELRKNLAKGIILYAKGSDMSNLFITTKDYQNDISRILIKIQPADQTQLLFENIMQLANLPSDLNGVREQIGHEKIIENLEEYKEDLLVDDDFMRKFGDVVKCYL
jgi:hypothetical protein